MEIKSLNVITREEVITCLLTAFSNYFVVLPDDVDYWKARYKAAQIDWSLSYGMFDGEKLVGFIINGIDVHEGRKTAYNSGTGVLPDYRGNAIVDRLYEHAFPEFRKAGIEKCLLEVICENERAMKVYNRIGFETRRKLYSFKGSLPVASGDLQLQNTSFSEILSTGLYDPKNYSWDNLSKPVEISEHNKNCFLLTSAEGELKGYLVLGPNGQVVQLEASENSQISEVLKSIRKVTTDIRFGNVPDHRTQLLNELKALSFENTINQYEMQLFLN